ncbi:MAG: hypothetical protein AAFR61_24925 [Bacteroidota bacterium]
MKYLLPFIFLLFLGCEAFQVPFNPPSINATGPSNFELVRAADSIAMFGFTDEGKSLFPGFRDGKLKRGLRWNGNTLQLTRSDRVLNSWGTLSIDSLSTSVNWQVEAGEMNINFQGVPLLLKDSLTSVTDYQKAGESYLSLEFY